jgi:hypothetical protein
VVGLFTELRVQIEKRKNVTDCRPSEGGKEKCIEYTLIATLKKSRLMATLFFYTSSIDCRCALDLGSTGDSFSCVLFPSEVNILSIVKAPSEPCQYIGKLVLSTSGRGFSFFLVRGMFFSRRNRKNI